MADYKVLREVEIAGKVRAEGTIIALEDDAAQPLVDSGDVALADGTAPATPPAGEGEAQATGGEGDGGDTTPPAGDADGGDTTPPAGSTE